MQNAARSRRIVAAVSSVYTNIQAPKMKTETEDGVVHKRVATVELAC